MGTIDDLIKNVKWGDLIGKLLKFVADNPNVTQLAISAGTSLVYGIYRNLGLSEEEARAKFLEEVQKLRERPDLPMDFEIDEGDES